jgi:hypothetical protein
MIDNRDYEQPSKAELRGQLEDAEPLREVGVEALDVLVRKAKIIQSFQTIASSDDESGFLHFVVRGVVRIELSGPPWRQPQISRFVGSGEFCPLPAWPRHSPYRWCAIAHAARYDARVAILAIWSWEAIRLALRKTPYEGVLRLLAVTWLLQSRLAAEERLLRALSLARRIAFVAEDLAARFGLPDPEGTLIDLPISDDMLAKLVGSTRSRVNKCLNHVPELRAVVRRASREFLVLHKPAADALEKSTASMTRNSGRHSAMAQRLGGKHQCPRAITPKNRKCDD